MRIRYAGKTWNVELLDDGTLDTVISVDGVEHRFNEDRPRRSRRAIRQLAIDAIESDERHWED